MSPTLIVHTIGGASRIGDSCTLLNFTGTNTFKILVDFGWQSNVIKYNDILRHINSIVRSFPLDCILLTHAHADHCAGLIPFFLDQRIPQNLACYCSPATKELCFQVIFPEKFREIKRSDLSQKYQRMLVDNYEMLCNNLQDKIKVITDDGLKFLKGTEKLTILPISAGHVLGALCYFLEWQKEISWSNKIIFRVVITGDICFENQTTVNGSPLFDNLQNFLNIDLLIVENTYDYDENLTKSTRDEKIQTLRNRIKQLMQNGINKLLIPVYSIGRAQEILTILLSDREIASKFPIFVGGTAQHGLQVYRKYLGKNVLPDGVNKIVVFSNNIEIDFEVFNANRIRNRTLKFNDIRSAIFLASSGILERKQHRKKGISVAQTIFNFMEDNGRDRIITVGWDGEEDEPNSMLNVLRRFKGFDEKRDRIHISAHTNGNELYDKLLNLIRNGKIKNVIFVHRAKEKSQLATKLKENLGQEYTNRIIVAQNGKQYSYNFG